jgi:HK97 family phage portal protein
MGLFSRQGGWAGLAGGEDRALPVPTVEPTYTFTGVSAPLNVSTANVLRVSDAWACVALLANSISTLPLHVFRKTDAGRVAAGPDSRVVQLLLRPSPGSTGTDLISQVVTHLAIFGEAFVGLYRSDGEIVQLGLIHPEQVQVELRGQRVVYTLSTRTGQVEVGPDDVLHVKGLSVDGLRGLSPVSQCKTALGLSSSL